MKKILLSILLIYCAINLQAQIAIDTSFEGANADILNIDNAGNSIKIASKFRGKDTKNVVFYLKVSGYKTSQALKIQVTNSTNYFLPVLAAYSYDQKNWSRISGNDIGGNTKEYSFTYSGKPVYFSSSFPYLLSDLTNLISSLSTNPYVTTTNIAKSEGGRDVKLLKVTDPCVPDADKSLVWILGRNHAFESNSSYVVEGFINFISSNDARANELRKRSIIYIVPIMDVDKVAVGGTGKDQKPRDFNRDWYGNSNWNAIVAVKNKIGETQAKNKFEVFIDSHNPFPGSTGLNERLFMYSQHNSGLKGDNFNFFVKALKENGGYTFDNIYDPSKLPDGQSADIYIDSLYTNTGIATTLETGFIYRTDGVEWTIPLYLNNGVVVAKGVRDFINNITKTGDIFLDNTDPSPSVEITGSWISSSFTPGYYGSNYIHNNNTGLGSKSVKYIPTIATEDSYQVFLKWTENSGNASNVPIRITYKGGIKDTTIDQRSRGGEWVSLGIYTFSAGTTGNVLLGTGGVDGYVVADAARFSKLSDCNSIITANNYETENATASVNVYPNPFTDAIHVSLENVNADNLEINIKNMLGQTMMKHYSSNVNGYYGQILDLTQLPKGMYLMETTVDGKVSTKKIIKQ